MLHRTATCDTVQLLPLPSDQNHTKWSAARQLILKVLHLQQTDHANNFF